MNPDANVYDLGDLATETKPRPSRRPPAIGPVTPVSASWPISLSLFVPGGGHLFGGEVAKGLAMLASIAFLVTSGWAIVSNLDRLAPTLELLGLPAHAGVWALGALYVLIGLVHVAGVVGAARSRSGSIPEKHPAVTGIASALIPGWGQAILGHCWSSALFLSGIWMAGWAWILVTPEVQALLVAQNLYLPRWLELFASTPVRWTLPVVIWVVAVYDASLRSARRT